MANPWEHIDLESYEAHMRAEGVLQLQALGAITGEQLAYGKASVAILGAAGGNGLEHVDPAVTTAVWAVDINDAYLAACRERFPNLAGVLKTVRCDLAAPGAALPACGLLICNLIVEYIGVPAFAALLRANRENLGVVSCVIQRSNGNAFVSESPSAARLQALGSLHRDVGEKELAGAVEGAGFRAALRKAYPLPGAKEFVRIDFVKKEP
jgi:hypothetical protein